jgi:hypothetical protein
MNKRIKELAEQATETVRCGLNGTSIAESFNREKFAELIVRECINKIETYEIPVGGSAAGEIACEMTYSALKQIRDEIKEHFGVEE